MLISPSLNHILSSFLGLCRTMAFGAKLTLIGMLSRILQRRTPSIWWDLPIPNRGYTGDLSVSALAGPGRPGGRLLLCYCLNIFQFPSFKTGGDNNNSHSYYEGQVPDNCFGNISNCGEIPFRGNPTPAPEWAAGYWAPVLSVTGWTPEPQECLTESILHVCCGQLGCSGSLYPVLNDPTQEGGSWGIYLQLPSCVGWELLLGVHHDPGAPEGASRPLWTEKDLRRGAQGCVGTSRQAAGDIQGGVKGSGRAGTIHHATGKGERPGEAGQRGHGAYQQTRWGETCRVAPGDWETLQRQTCVSELWPVGSS